MGFLDAYDTFVGNKCQELTQQNNTFDKLTKATGLSNIVKGVEDFISKDIVETLKTSSLRDLAEDLLSETIRKNTKRITQNILNQVPDSITGTLTDLRANAFNTVFSTLTLKNDMVMYFASTIAEEAVEAIRDKRRTLISLQEAVRKLHNALLVLAGGEPFFQRYLADLRKALLLLEDADTQLAIVRSGFFSQTVFATTNFNNAKALLEQVEALIQPPEQEAGNTVELNLGFLKAVVEVPDFGQQLGMLQSVPKLAMDMLAAYDLYAVKVLKVNALLLGFQGCVQNLQQVTGGKFKDLILKNMDGTRTQIQDVMKSMAKVLNGDELAIDGPITEEFGNPINVGGQRVRQTRPFTPKPTEASARAIGWLIRVKTARLSLNAINSQGLENLQLSNELLKEYNQAITDLGELDDAVTQFAVLRATDGREQPGDIEPQLVTFAFQANQAIVDSALLEASRKKFNEKTVIALGTQLNSRLQLSIDRDREIEQILLRFIVKTEPLLRSLKSLGDSLFKTLDSLGLDRATDFLKRGAFGDFFAMDGRTASYAGAAVAGLSFIQGLVGSQEERQCILQSINRIQVEDTSKKLASQRTVATNFVKQQKQNEETCAELKNDQKKTAACSSGINAGDLRDNPLNSLTALFRGVFGGDINDTLKGFGLGNFGEASGKGAGLGGLINKTTGQSSDSSQGVFSSFSYASKALEDAEGAANNALASAKTGLASAINGVTGFFASEDEDEADLEQKALAAKEKDSGNTALDDALANKKVADILGTEAKKAAKNKEKQSRANNFTKFGVS